MSPTPSTSTGLEHSMLNVLIRLDGLFMCGWKPSQQITALTLSNARQEKKVLRKIGMLHLSFRNDIIVTRYEVVSKLEVGWRSETPFFGRKISPVQRLFESEQDKIGHVRK